MQLYQNQTAAGKAYRLRTLTTVVVVSKPPAYNFLKNFGLPLSFHLQHLLPHLEFPDLDVPGNLSTVHAALDGIALFMDPFGAVGV